MLTFVWLLFDDKVKSHCWREVVLGFKRIMVLGDLHFPFHHKRALDHAIGLISANKPDYVIQIGDLYDFFSATKFPKKTFVPPDHEYLEGFQHAKEMWRRIREVSPTSICYQIKGNHDERPVKRMIEKLPDLLFFVEQGITEFFNFEGVTTIHDPREELQIDNVKFIHGYKSKLGDHSKFFRGNVVCGHSHKGGVFFEQYNEEVVFELNVGYLADENHPALKYRQTKTCQWTLGVGYIDAYGPRFVPFNK